jgi:hypothetical protein
MYELICFIPTITFVLELKVVYERIADCQYILQRMVILHQAFD